MKNFSHFQPLIFDLDMEKTVSDFLKLLNIPVSGRYVQKLIYSHPDFPSLLSVSDVLGRLGVNHVARRINEKNLTSVPFPYLLPLDKGRGDLLLIKNHSDLSKNKILLDQWNGVVLQAEPTRTINDLKNNEFFSQELTLQKLAIGFGAILIVAILLSCLAEITWLRLCLLVTALGGVATGYFLITKELGVAGKTIDAFCNTGKNNNCDKVLKADVKFFGVGFSEAAITYFIFQAATLILVATFPASSTVLYTVLLMLSAATLPVIVFSLYYQKFIAKTWCKLCLVVVAILFAQAALFSIAFFFNSLPALSLGFLPVFWLVLLFAGIGISIKLIKTTYTYTTGFNHNNGGDRIKHNADVFLNFLNKQKKLAVPFAGKEIIVGNVESPLHFVMVTNLYCNPCREKHKVVDDLLTTYSDKMCVSFRFVKSADYTRDGLDSVSYLLGAWLTHANGRPKEQEITLQLLNDWFDLWDLEKFAKKWFVSDVVKEECKRLAEAHNMWADEIGIRQTPTIFLNGYQMPKEYNMEDFLMMAPALGEKLKNIKQAELQMG
ncbi:MAG: thioredoxin domain-containing protein [Cytophagales bacterium]|nr:thioredoxin domain-containing protein [Cytophagales bacterium]